MPSRSGTQDDRGVDDIGGAGDSTQLACRAGALIVERLDLRNSGTEQAGQASLTSTIAPDLADNARRNRETQIEFQGTGQDRDDGAIVALEGDERAGIECQAAHFGFRRRLP